MYVLFNCSTVSLLSKFIKVWLYALWNGKKHCTVLNTTRSCCDTWTYFTDILYTGLYEYKGNESSLIYFFTDLFDWFLLWRLLEVGGLLCVVDALISQPFEHGPVDLRGEGEHHPLLLDLPVQHLQSEVHVVNLSNNVEARYLPSLIFNCSLFCRQSSLNVTEVYFYTYVLTTV